MGVKMLPMALLTIVGIGDFEGSKAFIAPRVTIRPKVASHCVGICEVPRRQSIVPATMVTTEESLKIEELRFLTPETAEAARSLVGTPAYVYDMASLKANAKKCLDFPSMYGLTVRFAMKSLPTKAVLQLFDSMGIHFDCSSGWEVRRAIAAGVFPEKLSLSTQELPSDFKQLLSLGVEINACSLSQLTRLGKEAPGSSIGVRFNPGLGSGGTKRTNVGGPSSSFGVWHELAGDVKSICEEYELKVETVHTHIGSGSDPAVWQKVAGMTLDLVRQFPDVKTVDLGGGYKTGRMMDEVSTDMQAVGMPVRDAFHAFSSETGRELKLEIEPGTFLVANAGALITTVQDVVTTGSSGYDFIKLDAGMTDLLRPSLYGALHPIVIVPSGGGGRARGKSEYVVVGHCCESGDLLTPKVGSPEEIDERLLTKADIGDLCVVEGCGAYVSGMCAKNYNSFPEAPEMMLDGKGELHVIRQRQQLEQITQNEVEVPLKIFK